MKDRFASIVCLPVLAAAAAWAPAPALAQKGPTLSPDYCTKPAYPKEALRYELEGRTRVRYQVSPEGRVTEVEVEQSSGWQLLDDATVQSLASCNFPAAQAAAWQGKTFRLVYGWKLSRRPVRAVLLPDSCHESQAYAQLVPLDDQPSDDRGVKVRFLLDAAGQPYGVKPEPLPRYPRAASQLEAYVQSCRFAAESRDAQRSSTDTMYGRVLLR